MMPEQCMKFYSSCKLLRPKIAINLYNNARKFVVTLNYKFKSIGSPKQL